MNFTVVGKREDLVIHAVADASYKIDAPSIGGNLIMLGNKNTDRVSPIYWKSKQIPKVCHSAKDAETRNIMTNVDTAVYLSQQLSILLFEKSESKIPVRVYTDSLPLLESIASPRQVDQHLLRNTMTDSKQKLMISLDEIGCFISDFTVNVIKRFYSLTMIFDFAFTFYRKKEK